MKLRVVHRTAYAYSEPVSTSHHEAHLAPRDGERRRTLVHDVAINPSPSLRRERFDYFGNRVLFFSLREPHRALEVVTTSVVDLGAVPPPPLESTPPWESVRDRVQGDRRRDLLDAYSFVFDSPMVKNMPALRDYAAPSFPAGRPLLEAVRELTARIRSDFVYDTAATDLATPLSEVLRPEPRAAESHPIVPARFCRAAAEQSPQRSAESRLWCVEWKQEAGAAVAQCQAVPGHRVDQAGRPADDATRRD